MAYLSFRRLIEQAVNDNWVMTVSDNIAADLCQAAADSKDCKPKEWMWLVAVFPNKWEMFDVDQMLLDAGTVSNFDQMEEESSRFLFAPFVIL